MELDTKSMIQTTTVMISVATSTITVDCCNIGQLGQVTFSSNSLYDSRKYVEILFIFFLQFTKAPSLTLLVARALGFEPRLKVLETSVLPLYYARPYNAFGI